MKCRFCGATHLDAQLIYLGDCCHAKACTKQAWSEYQQAHQRAIWLDGPDSEAARAFRGEGSFDPWLSAPITDAEEAAVAQVQPSAWLADDLWNPPGDGSEP